MNKEINALVLKTTPYKESSLLLTVLTKENGKQNILCRGVKKGRRGKLFAEKFAYSKMRIYVGRGVPVVDEAELTESFYPLREDIEKLSLADYFCEVALSVPFGGGDENLLRLLLNSFWMLCFTQTNPVIIKTVFELKFSQQEGFAPSEFDCRCGKKAEKWSFSQGFLCSDCAEGDGVYVPSVVVNAVKNVLCHNGKGAYRIDLDEKSLFFLSEITEKYLEYHTDKRFETLKYYRKFTEADFGKNT